MLDAYKACMLIIATQSNLAPGDLNGHPCIPTRPAGKKEHRPKPIEVGYLPFKMHTQCRLLILDSSLRNRSVTSSLFSRTLAGTTRAPWRERRAAERSQGSSKNDANPDSTCYSGDTPAQDTETLLRSNVKSKSVRTVRIMNPDSTATWDEVDFL